MQMNDGFSLLYPNTKSVSYKQLSESTCHDLGLDTICQKMSDDRKEQRLIMSVLSTITCDSKTAIYRQKIFADILALPELRERMLKLFEKIEFIRSFSTSNKNIDEKTGIWHLLHRLDELDDYIKCVEEMSLALTDAGIKSEGLFLFKKFIDELYKEAYFDEMKKDITALKKSSSNIQSVTLGINVNDRFEAVGVGLVSVNSKPFKKSGIIKNFAEAISSGDNIKDTAEWNGSMQYHQVAGQKSGKVLSMLEKAAGIQLATNPFFNSRSTMSTIVNDDGASTSTFYLEEVLNKMLVSVIGKLRNTLSKYAGIAIVNISKIIPEFIYYIRAAEFIERCKEKGFEFCEPTPTDCDSPSMTAKGFYNLKLAISLDNCETLVCNDLCFDKEKTVYILTGANRGGKTTLTQAVGLLYVFAQAGIYVPATEFCFRPADCIYTHFPADEDKTMDLGRLGEECIRFKEIFSECTSDSLLLLNETYSTTSLEEGYYIAKDSVKAILSKKIRTIYNTHMHKLAQYIPDINSCESEVKSASLVMKSHNGERSFKAVISEPEGQSYARDIAEKYGVTYDMLMNKS